MNKKRKENILIVGAGVAGQELLQELKKYFSHSFVVKGFLDDGVDLQGKQVMGIPVLGMVDRIRFYIKKENISQVFIAIPSAQGELIRRIVKSCEKERVVFKIIPRVLDIVQGKVKISRVREIQPEDLLGRSIIKTQQSFFKKYFRGKTIFVSGGAGSIGSELCRQIVEFNPKKLVIYDMWESGLFEIEQELIEKGKGNLVEAVVGNILDYPKLENVIRDFKPDYIFHAAAYKHVPLMQKYPAEAAKNNIIGTFNMAKAAERAKVKVFVNISTDKAVNPFSVLGATKKIAEKIIGHFNDMNKTKYCSVRFGNVLGSQGSVFVTFRKQIAKGGPLTVTSKKMYRYFMSIPEASQLVLHSSLLVKEGGEIFVLDMGEAVNVEELARVMIRMSGFIPDEDIKIKYSGVRLGEKMNEKLFDKDERMFPTDNKKINMILKRKEKVNPQQIVDYILKHQLDNNAIVNFLRVYAPNIK